MEGERKAMAEVTHLNPSKTRRFKILVQLSHVQIPGITRSYAGITIYRDTFVPFNWRNPTTWPSGKWVASGSPASINNIVVSTRFEDFRENDVSDALNLFKTNLVGHIGEFCLFIHWGSPVPDDLRNDARTVKRVILRYQLPWEDDERKLSQS
jgi:hypothetical protein